LFVKLKLADRSPVVAVTTYGPADEFAVNTEETATPLASVRTVSVALVVLWNVPLAHVAGAVNVTGAPLTGLEFVSSTVAVKGRENAVLMRVFWPDPAVAVIEATVPVMFESEKVAGVETPLAEAETV
jgi:hypothetical protein